MMRTTQFCVVYLYISLMAGGGGGDDRFCPGAHHR